jgi:methyl-accepting chemotaxis protein
MTACTPEESLATAESDRLSRFALLDTVDQVQAIVEYGADGTILRANAGFLALMGYTANQLVGKHLVDLGRPGVESLEHFDELWQRLGSGQTVSGEYLQVARDGRHLWLQCRFTPVPDAQGALQGVIQLASDITESKQVNAEVQAQLDAIDRVQAVIEFDLGGHVLHANQNFLDLTGYTLAEVQGQHHRLFCEASYSQSPAYTAFWQHLSSGQLHSGEFKRLAKNGREIWIQASYNPVFDPEGYPVKVVKYATDVTERKLQGLEVQAMMAAIDRVQAVIEFDLGGHVLHANPNFLRQMGYTLDEVRGQHHRLFCDPAYAQSEDYAEFWHRLASGQVHNGEFKRRRRDGSEVWIQASYNPVFDPEGHPVKVVKFATDVTASRYSTSEANGKLAALSRSQAVIEFDLLGNVLGANHNFLRMMGYTDGEVTGLHHSLFCEPEQVHTPGYRHFWADLAQGQFKRGRFRRCSKLGSEVWIHATYNPILDSEGRPYKIVKFATDITERVQREQQQAQALAALQAQVSQLSRQLEGTAQQVGQAHELARQLRQDVLDGSRSTARSVSTLGEMRQVAMELHDLVPATQAWTSQTHQLALGAGMEAARAGEHGAGLGVVADGLRQLAQQADRQAQAVGTRVARLALQASESCQRSEQLDDALGRLARMADQLAQTMAQLQEASDAVLEDPPRLNQALDALCQTVAPD